MRMLGHMQLTVTINNPNRNPNARPNPKLTQTFAFHSLRVRILPIAPPNSVVSIPQELQLSTMRPDTDSYFLSLVAFHRVFIMSSELC